MASRASRERRRAILYPSRPLTPSEIVSLQREIAEVDRQLQEAFEELEAEKAKRQAASPKRAPES